MYSHARAKQRQPPNDRMLAHTDCLFTRNFIQQQPTTTHGLDTHTGTDGVPVVVIVVVYLCVYGEVCKDLITFSWSGNINRKPFYSPREFASFILVGVYIPPQANVQEAHHTLIGWIRCVERTNPDSLVSVLGEFKKKGNLTNKLNKLNMDSLSNARAETRTRRITCVTLQ